MRFNRPNTHSLPVPSAFVNDLMDDWRVNGREAITRVRKWAPQRYLHLVAALAPAGTSEADRLDALSHQEFMKEYYDMMAREHADGSLPPFLRFVPLGED